MNYFDHSATTPINEKVLDHINQVQSNFFGNPSSVHHLGQKARALTEKARLKIANAINAEANQIIFTSGGTESNNQVFFSMVNKNKNHILSSTIEHPAVSKSIRFLENFGIKSSIINVNSKGIVKHKDLFDAITADTGLISIMLANNEIGSIQPLREITKYAHKKGILVHTDAVQCLGKINIDVKKLKVDFLSLSAHKFYGPKGVGILFAKNPSNLMNLIIGGSQEHNLRGGTENVASISGMGLAAEIVTSSFNNHVNHLKVLEDKFKKGINQISKHFILNGTQSKKIPGLISVSFPGYDSNILMRKLNREKIYVSNGSACGSGDVKPSFVLKAIGISDSLSFATLRFSFGITNTEDQINFLISKIKSIIKE